MRLLPEKVWFRLGDWDSADTLQAIQYLFGNYYFELNGEFHHTDCKTSGDIVTCAAIFYSDWQTTAGINGHHFNKAEFSIRDNKIECISYQGERGANNKLLNFFVLRFADWENKNHPDEFTNLRMTPYGPGSGKIFSARLKEFAATLQ